MLTIAIHSKVAGQITNAILMNEAISGNWSDNIWTIGGNPNTTFTTELWTYYPTTFNIMFQNTVHPIMNTDTEFSTQGAGNLPARITFTPSAQVERTFNGTETIDIHGITNTSNSKQTFNIPLQIADASTIFLSNAELSFLKPLSSITGTTLTLNQSNDNCKYIFKAPANFETLTINAPADFQSETKVVNKLTVNSPTIFYNPTTIGSLEVNKEGKGTTFKAPVTVTGDAIGHGVTSYESSLTIKGNLTIEDTTGIQMPTTVGTNCYINAPFYIVDSLKVSGDWYVTAPIHIMQSVDHSRQGYLEVNKEDHTFPELNIYNGGKATIRNGSITNLNFMDGSTNLTMSNEHITNLSYVRSAYDERKLPVSGTGVKVTNSTITMQFPSSDYYYMIGFPFDVTFEYDPNNMLVFEYDGNVRGNGVTGWKKFTGSTLTAGKGYAFASNVPVIFTAANGANEYSKTTGSSTLAYYTGSSPLKENYGWNSITTPFANPQPLQLNEGMFVYQYEPESDTYYTYRSGESFTARPFEGFFIKTVEGQLNAQFSQPVDNTPVRARRSMPNAINLELISNGYTYPTRIKFDERTTTGYDELYDAPYTAGMSPNTTQFYSFCAGQNGQYAINSIPEEIEEINLGFRLMNTNGGTSYTITWENMAGMDLELYDAEMQIATDMVSLNSYSFMVANDGINTERFVIRKKNASGPTTSIEQALENKNILIQEGAIIINTEDSTYISIYDIMGRTIAEGYNKGQQQYNIGQPGIYVVKINGEATKVLVK